MMASAMTTSAKVPTLGGTHESSLDPWETDANQNCGAIQPIYTSQ